MIGAGHNGLVAALVLARAGLEVTVLEAGTQAGGCIWTERLPSGHRLERGAIDHTGLLGLADELGLAQFGLRFAERDTLTTAVFGDGTNLAFPTDAAQAAAAFGVDEAAYLDLVDLAGRLLGMLDHVASAPTPAELAVALARLPGGDGLFRLLLSSADDVLGRCLHDAHLRSAVAMHAAHGQLPPWLPGSGLFALLLPGSHGTPPVRPLGGSVAVVHALEAALAAAGGVVRKQSAVTGLRPGTTGVVVEVGEGGIENGLEVDLVVSGLDVVRTARLLGEAADPALMRAAGSVGSGRLNVAELKVDVAVDVVPDLGPVAGDRSGLWLLQPHPDTLRRQFGDLLAGRRPAAPAVMAAMPSAHDPDSAPPGGAVFWLSSVVPIRLADGPWTPQAEQEAAEAVLGTVRDVLGVDLTTSQAVVTGPRTWPGRLGSTDGNPNHLDLTIDQLLGWRPPGLAGPRGAAPWLYLCGAGVHPGGGLSGASGLAAAQALLADLGTAGRGRAPGDRQPRHRRAVRDHVSALWAGWRFYRRLAAGV